MKVNLDKTKIIVFRNGGYLRSYEKWYYKGKQVETVKHYNYLGLLISSRLSWSPAKTNLASKGVKALFPIQTVIRKLGGLALNDAFKLFDSVVVPAICYGSDIWGFEYSDAIEQVQLKYCTFVLGVISSANKQVLLGECDILPLCCVYFKRIAYWLKI